MRWIVGRCCMNATVSEWVDKAAGDLASALRELRARKSPNFDSACLLGPLA